MAPDRNLLIEQMQDNDHGALNRSTHHAGDGGFGVLGQDGASGAAGWPARAIAR